LALVPEEGNGLALKEGDKEEDNSGADGDGHNAVDNPDVELSDRDSEEEVTDGDFGGNHCEAVP
jgi:hypothetical protein